MRREQRVGRERLIARETRLDEQHIAVLAGRYPQSELEALVTVDDAHRRYARGGELNDVLPQSLDLDPETRAIAHEKTEIADLRDIDARIVDLVDDPAADGEPQSRGAERAADHVLVAAAPGRYESPGAPGASLIAACGRDAEGRGRRCDHPGVRGSHNRRPPVMKAWLLPPRRTPRGSFFNRRAFHRRARCTPSRMRH